MRLSLRLLSTLKGRQFVVTTPIFYVNAAPHLGHVYSAVVADAAARVELLQHPTSRVTLTTGTDEHGDKIQRAAVATGHSLPHYCHHISAQYQDVLSQLDVDYTDFVRTTQDRHKKAVQHFWSELDRRGFIYKTRYSGWYCVSDETFLNDLQISEVEREGKKVKVSSESGHPVEWTEEDNYMFRLSQMKEPLLDWLNTGGVVTPEKYRCQLISSLQHYLPDISVSRPVSRVHWAVPVPADDSQSVYVWLDALVNYLTTTGYPAAAARRSWPADLHVIGKDILKFHGIYWPAFLMAAGLPPPRRLLCHAHWTVGGVKMSKSLGNVVDPLSTPGGAHALRYFLLREATMHSDANYSAEKLVRTVNSELADSLGNLLARSTRPAINPNGVWPPLRRADCATATGLMSLVERLPDTCRPLYADYLYYRVADSCLAVLHAANATFDSERPWQLVKRADADSQARLGSVLHLTLESLRVTALMLWPIAPRIAAAVLDKLAIPHEERSWHHAEQVSWRGAGGAGRSLSPEQVVVFPRVQRPRAPLAAAAS